MCALRDIVHWVAFRRSRGIISISILELRGSDAAFPIRWAGTIECSFYHVPLRLATLLAKYVDLILLPL
jgi:hypothetical protein